MATAVDIGNPVDIHPVNKAEVARRLAIIALDRVYGMKQICEAPACTSVVNDGKSVTLTFSGPVKAVGGVATGFIIGDRTGKWVSGCSKMIDDRIRLQSAMTGRTIPEAISTARTICPYCLLQPINN